MKQFNPIVKHLLFVFVLTALLSTMIVVPVLAQTQSGVISTDDVFADVYEQVSPSVVAINVVARRPDSGFFNQDETVIGGGTGFVIDTDGHIVTNNHVVDGAIDIEISFLDGTLARAEIVGLDPDSDLAVIRAELPEEQLRNLQPVAFSNSDDLRIGQSVLAIGGPFGQRWTLTSGIVSALGRSIRGLTNFSIGGVIQTDAAINPGNSGGPLLDLNGNVIGVNSQIISSSRSSAGIGFAIPGNLAQRVAQQLIDNGFVNYSYLGITGGDITLSLIEAFELPNNTQGVVISETMPGGPAARAGLEDAVFAEATTDANTLAVPTSMDIITAIDGEPIAGISELVAYLAANTEPGQTVTLNVLRNGTEELQLEARLTPRP